MSSPTDLSKLGRVNAGDDVRGVARAERIMALQNITKSHVDGHQFSQSGNLNRIIGPGWVIQRRRKVRTFPSGSSTTSPFEVISQTNPETGALQLGVIADSHLFNSESRDFYEFPSISGLLDVDQTTGWFDVTVSDIGKKFWLEIELQEEDQVIIGVQVRYDFPGSSLWTQFPDPIEIDTESDPKAQQFFHQIIAEVTNPDVDPREGSMTLTIPDSGGTKIQITQLLFDNVLMTTGRTTHDADEPNLPLLVNAYPYGPATDTGGTGTPFPQEDDLMTPWQFGTVEAENHYDFELVDASDSDGAKVLIYDGVVYAADNPGFDPDGMPSDDNFILSVDDGDEIWVGFTYENDLNFEITSCFIDHGAETPDDDPENNTAYVTIGHVDVEVNEPDSVNVVTPHNEVCGDIFWEPPRKVSHFNFQIEDASEGESPQVLIYDGAVIGPNDDPIDPAGMPSGNSYQIAVNDEDEIWVGVQWDLETDDAVSGDNITSVWIDHGSSTPDDNELTQYITIGHVDVNFNESGGESFAQVFPFNEVGGDIVIQYPPHLDSETDSVLTVDKDTGNIVWKKKGVTVSSYNLGTDEDDTADNVTEIRLEPASDPSQAYVKLVDEGVTDGEHTVTLQVPLIPESPGGFVVLTDDDGDTHWEETCNAECDSTKCGDGEGCP